MGIGLVGVRVGVRLRVRVRISGPLAKAIGPTQGSSGVGMMV